MHIHLKLILVVSFVFFQNLAWAVLPLPTPEKTAFLKNKLNSERIEYFFGSYQISDIKVCQKDLPNTRVSILSSVHHKKKAWRTLAFVEFFQPVAPDLEKLHQKILSGGSIGATFKAAGYAVEKDHFEFGQVSFSHGRDCAVQKYQLSVRSNGRRIPYCQITEIHSPEYLTLQWLKALYPTEFSSSPVSVSFEISKPTRSCLKRLEPGL